MYIYYVEFSCARYRGQDQPIKYGITKFKVKKDKKNYYIRDNKNEDDDQTYDDINTYKVFNEDQEYDYEDEVLNHPQFFVFNDYEVSGAISLLHDDLEKVQDIIIEHIERKFEEKINKIKAMTGSFVNRSNWERH